LYLSQIKGFELWAKTEQGQDWLSERAQAGLKIIMSDGNVIFDAKKEGLLSKKGIDASFEIKGSERGLTEYKISENGERVEFTYSMIPDANSLSPSRILQNTEVWLHEALFHGDIAERDFLGKKTDHGGRVDPGTILYTGYHTKHDTDLKNSRYGREALPIMGKAAKSLGLNYDRNTLWYKYMAPGFTTDFWR
jgi:hypothetical protein